MKNVFILLISLFLWSGTVSAQNLFPQAMLPVLPETLEFAGESVPLNNFDTRESLQREISVTMYMHSRTIYTLLRTTRYFPVIEPILKKNGIPDDFKYLCMAESGLDPEVRSPAGAAGLWQLMPAVGRSYGMEVGKGVDERYHVEMATEAACRHLKESYERFGSWTLAAAAYNLGLSGVATRLEKQGVSNYYDAFFPQETLRYVFRILSFKVVTEHPLRYGFLIEEDDYLAPLDRYREVTVNDAKIDWAAFARAQGTNYKMLRAYNPWIRDYDSLNPSRRTYTVRIPLDGHRNQPAK